MQVGRGGQRATPEFENLIDNYERKLAEANKKNKVLINMLANYKEVAVDGEKEIRHLKEKNEHLHKRINSLKIKNKVTRKPGGEDYKEMKERVRALKKELHDTKIKLKDEKTAHAEVDKLTKALIRRGIGSEKGIRPKGLGESA